MAFHSHQHLPAQGISGVSPHVPLPQVSQVSTATPQPPAAQPSQHFPSHVSATQSAPSAAALTKLDPPARGISGASPHVSLPQASQFSTATLQVSDIHSIIQAQSQRTDSLLAAQSQRTESLIAAQSQQTAAILRTLVERAAAPTAAISQTVITIDKAPSSKALEPEQLRQDFQQVLRHIKKFERQSPDQASPGAIFIDMPALFGHHPEYRLTMERFQQEIIARCNSDGLDPGMAELKELWECFIDRVDDMRAKHTAETWHKLRMLPDQTPQQFAEHILRLVPSVQKNESVDFSVLMVKFMTGIGPAHPEVLEELRRYKYSPPPHSLREAAEIAQRVFNSEQGTKLKLASMRAQIAALDPTASKPAPPAQDKKELADRPIRQDRYCERHGKGSHSTADCIVLQRERERVFQQPAFPHPPSRYQQGPPPSSGWGPSSRNWQPDPTAGHAFAASGAYGYGDRRQPRAPFPPCIYCGVDKHKPHQCYLVRPDLVEAYRPGWRPHQLTPPQQQDLFRQHLQHYQRTGRLMAGVLPPGEQQMQRPAPAIAPPPPQLALEAAPANAPQPLAAPPPPRAAMVVQGPVADQGGAVPDQYIDTCISPQDVRVMPSPTVAATEHQPSVFVRAVFGMDDSDDESDNDAAEDRYLPGTSVPNMGPPSARPVAMLAASPIVPQAAPLAMTQQHRVHSMPLLALPRKPP